MTCSECGREGTWHVSGCSLPDTSAYARAFATPYSQEVHALHAKAPRRKRKAKRRLTGKARLEWERYHEEKQGGDHR